MNQKNKPQSNNILYFASCTAKDEIVHSILKEKVVFSAYHVCGFDPWLIIFKCNSQKDLNKFNAIHNINIRYLSFGFEENLVSGLDLTQNYKIKTWLFLRSSMEYLVQFLKDHNYISRFNISEAYSIFGEYQFIIRIHSNSIEEVDTFLSLCRDNGISTSTKCVLNTLKEGSISFSNSINKSTALDPDDLEYAAARVMANTEDFISMTEDEQFSYLSDKLCEMKLAFTPEDIKANLLFPKNNAKSLCKQDLIHNNSFIDRYSIKLNRPGWLKTLIFFRAEQGKKKDLERILQNDFLGVFPNWFSRKLFHMTGDFDFIIPFDCRNLRYLRIAISDFYKKFNPSHSMGNVKTNKENIIERIHTTICLPSNKQMYGKPLFPIDIPIIESLLINSTFIREFEASIRSRSLFSSFFAGTRLPLNEEGVSPREDYLRNKLENVSKTSLEWYLNNFQSFSQIGIEATIEFEDGKLLQALFKFHTKSPIHRNQLVNDIKSKTERNELIALINIPVADPSNVMCIFTVKDISELEFIYENMLSFCTKLEVHMIFHQKYYSKVIEQNIRCRPCFNYITPLKGCNSNNCFGCQNWTDCSYQKCGVCIRYVTKRSKNTILNIKYNGEIKNQIRIALVSPNTLNSFGILRYLLNDNDYDIQNMFGNIEAVDDYLYDNTIKDYFNKFREYYLHQDEPQEIQFIQEYEKNVLECISHLRKERHSDIIIFPEYSIPLKVFNKLKTSDSINNCILIAGSHIHNSFNICPIIFARDGKKEIYFSYKNALSPFEIQHKIAENSGTGYFKFNDQMMGKIFVLICYDAFKTGENLSFSDVDILLAPSANISKSFVERLREISKRYFIISAYTNLFNLPNLDMQYKSPEQIAAPQDIHDKERRYCHPGKIAEKTLLSSIHYEGRKWSEKNPFFYKIIKIDRADSLIKEQN